MGEIAQALEVDYVVEGSVRKAGSQVRITAQLIDVGSDSHLWSQTYDRELSDIFAVQDEIARGIADALRLKLDLGSGIPLVNVKTSNMQAYELYLRGRQVWRLRRREALLVAESLLQRAVELVPSFAHAWADLAVVYLVQSSQRADNPVIKEIRATLGQAAAERAQAKAEAASERFNKAHPDAEQVMQDPEFRKWVAASRVRIELLARAHKNFDFDAGDEVFGTWKALRKPATPPADATPSPDAAAASEAARTLAAAAKRKRELAAGQVPSGNSGAAPAAPSKKIYRRADILKLMEEDNERYQALAPELERAYREGRVR